MKNSSEVWLTLNNFSSEKDKFWDLLDTLLKYCSRLFNIELSEHNYLVSTKSVTILKLSLYQNLIIYLCYSPSNKKGLIIPTCRSQEVSGTYPSIFSGGTASSTTVMVEPFQVSIMRRPLSDVTRVHCFLSCDREKLWISWVKDCMFHPERI